MTQHLKTFEAFQVCTKIFEENSDFKEQKALKLELMQFKMIMYISSAFIELLTIHIRI